MKVAIIAVQKRVEGRERAVHVCSRYEETEDEAVHRPSVDTKYWTGQTPSVLFHAAFSLWQATPERVPIISFLLAARCDWMGDACVICVCRARYI